MSSQYGDIQLVIPDRGLVSRVVAAGDEVKYQVGSVYNADLIDQWKQGIMATNFVSTRSKGF